MAITVETVGRRFYIKGDTFPLKDALRGAGCKWDPDARAWWTGKKEVADRFAASGDAAPASGSSSSKRPGEGEGEGADTVVAGKATYRGQTYYVVGRVVRGRTRYDDWVEPVVTRDGSRVLLAFRDGSRTVWAPLSGPEAARFDRHYKRPQTIGGLKVFAEEAKRARENGEGCYFCGSITCEGARGSLCEHD